ncbi:MAG: hypothetical protein EOO08_03870 [Chitinophagaceae bacterium]|nr:MAG: hypothetical protein EOO08_03870 [Chitinophagaceae bacterium]
MTVPQFRAFSARKKKITVLRTGSFLCERKRGLFRTMLYQVDGFYAEIWFFRFGREVLWYNAFDNTQQLQPYLKQIDISGLLGNLSLQSNP